MFNMSPQMLVSAVITLMVALTFHEVAHAWMAKMFGDDTAERAGRLTLNPLAHLDPIGSLMLILVGFGWAKPVPINPYALRRSGKAALMLVSIAGPLANLILAILAAIPLRFQLIPIQIASSNVLPTPYMFLEYFLYVNLALMIFNLLPIPPLDGHEILSFILPADLAARWESFGSQYGTFLLIALLMIGPLLGFDFVRLVMQPVIIFIRGILLGMPL
jgi:Zn-dependent protease